MTSCLKRKNCGLIYRFAIEYPAEIDGCRTTVPLSGDSEGQC